MAQTPVSLLVYCKAGGKLGTLSQSTVMFEGKLPMKAAGGAGSTV